MYLCCSGTENGPCNLVPHLQIFTDSREGKTATEEPYSAISLKYILNIYDLEISHIREGCIFRFFSSNIFLIHY